MTKKRHVVIRLHPPRFLQNVSFAGVTKYIPAPLRRWWRRANELCENLLNRFPFTRTERGRFATMGILVLFIVSEIFSIYQPFFDQNRYTLGSAASLLSEISEPMAKKIAFNMQSQAYEFNTSYQTTTTDSTSLPAQSKASFYKDPAKGVTVNDPSTSTSLSMKPKFNLYEGKQDGNRIVYPLSGKAGWLVYSAHSIGVKEDILLTASPGDTASFSYTLDLADGTEARLSNDGSVGIYGNSILSGNITTGTEADADLLEKARENAAKDTLLFSIPAPVIVDKKGTSSAEARFELVDNVLTVKASRLDAAHYPLSIDPSIYVVTAQQFMQGNNETNIDFNVADKLIQKGRTTGARFDDWTASSTGLPAPAWGGAAVATGGYLYQAGGTTFNGQTFTAQGYNSYTVPTGITSLTFEAWGGGGGGGGGSNTTGGTGGGGGYVQSTVSVTPGETLTIYIGGGGEGGTHNALGTRAGGGGGGGGYTAVYRGATLLMIAAGGAGGGGARENVSGGAGGAGGGTTGVAGTSIATTNGGGGGGGTQSAGGAGGINGSTSGNSGAAGGSLTGGAGGDGRASQSTTDGSGALGGGGGGGNGGSANVDPTRAGGGGGGGGYFGGGGGAGTTSTTTAAGGGGGGGSSYTIAGSTGVTNSAGSGTNPGNASDPSRNGAGTGGAAGAAVNNGGKGSGGALLITNGSGGSTVSSALSWAYLNTDSGAIEGANPGAGTCSGWCSTSEYSLPEARTNLSLVAYNGYLYAIGGTNNSGTRVNTIYVAKLGANGEPAKWHPTSTDQSTWTYWHATTTLSSTRSHLGAVAYNNRLYIIGGLTGTGTGTTVSSTEYADINPNGTLSSWTTGTALSGGLQGHSVQSYNDRLYVLGGASAYNGSPTATVRYIKLTSSGSMTGGWQTNTNSFATARISGGGNMTAVWGGYMYISGGCGAVNASGYCTTVLDDTQVASINADGSLDVWNRVGTVGTVLSQRTGASLVSWRNTLYHIGGCGSQNTSTGDCDSAMLGTVSLGEINQDGDASTVGESFAVGSGTCTGGTPTDCNIPGSTYIGNMLAATVITNGYLYIIGGCTNNTCSTTSNDHIYASISSTGVLSAPAVCTGGTIQNNIWCSNTTNTLSTGVAASSPVVFGGRIYLVGGLTGSANTNRIDRATINSDGSLGTWANQTMTSVDTGSNALEAQSYLYAYARANPESAGTSPGNLFIFGGCSSSSAAGCTAYSPDVHKCLIAASDGAISGCNASGQLQIGAAAGSGAQGLGLMTGTVYANYVYLIGGVASSSLVDLRTVHYAKIDNNNNVVAVSGSAWIQSPQQLTNGRRRASGFGYNGYLYVVGGFEAGGGGVLRDIEFIKINVSDGSLDTNGFSESAVTINQRWGLSVPISNSYAYVIGGCTVGDSPGGCTTRTDVVQTFQIYNNDSGSPAGYTTSANTYATNPNRVGASATVMNGYLYVAGGCTSTTDCTTAIDTVSYSAIDSATGALGSWSNTSANLPGVRTWGKLLGAGGTLYYVGGQDSSSNEQTSVYYGTPSSGNVSTWGTASNGLPAGRTKFGAAVWNDRLYVVGGLSDGTDVATDTNTVYVSPQLTSGGNITSAWASSTAFTVSRYGGAVTAYANNLYLLGGNDGTNFLSDVQFSKIDPTDGTVGSWTYSTSIPATLSQAEAFAANGYIYLLGGRSGTTTCDPVTLAAPISANTTIDSGNNPTGVGEWYETNQRYTGARYGAAVAYSQGKAYVAGGACGAYSAPTVSSITTTNTGSGFATDSTTHNVAMPGSTAAGDLLLMFFSYDSNGPPTVTDPDGAGGWTQLTAVNSATNGAFGSVWAKVATGSDGATVNFATSNTQSAAAQVYHIPADSWYGDITNGIAYGNAAGATTANPNPPSLTPSWGAINSLWIAYAAGGTHTGVSSYPTNYTNGSHASGNTTTNGASVSTARRELAAATEDPGTFTMASSQTSVAFTVAIRPAEPTLTYASPVTQQTPLLSQAQIARYSIEIDTDTDVFPTSWLLNGVDNSIGAKWRLIYRSMHDLDTLVNPNEDCGTSATMPTMTTWGQDTTHGDVTLGTLGAYTPKNSSGGNINCARYYYFNVSVDSSQAYGYPDDVTRGPTITDLTLQFTADPSKRLMHGRTFTGGLQQPIDTPNYAN